MAPDADIMDNMNIIDDVFDHRAGVAYAFQWHCDTVYLEEFQSESNRSSVVKFICLCLHNLATVVAFSYGRGEET